MLVGVCRARMQVVLFPRGDDSCLTWIVEVRSFSFLSASASSTLILLCKCFASAFLYKTFSQNLFRGPLGINLSMGRNTGRGKVFYNWISPDPAKVGPTLGGVVVVVVSMFIFV